MKNALFILMLLSVFACNYSKNKEHTKTDKLLEKLFPNDYLDIVTAYPTGKFDIKAYKAAMQEVKQLKNENSNAFKKAQSDWELIGPTNIGGRINTIATDPNNENVIYVGAAKGGVFKTTNGGSSWNPIFDEQSYLSIGDIAVDPNNSNSVFVGTGDVNISGSHYIGDGLYHSTDAGNTWTNIGLEETFVISHIKIHPLNSNIIYVSAMGLPQDFTTDRGVYKSIDGGANWNQVLFLNDSTGIIDLAIDPTNTEIVYAASWNRYRTSYQSVVNSVNNRIYKTTDGGANWNRLENGLPYDISNPNMIDTVSRIAIIIDETNPNRLFAHFTDDTQNTLGVFKTLDAGNNWTEVGPVNANSGFGWYFGKIRINPFAPNEIFVLDVELWKSNDNGDNWHKANPDWWTYEVHADKHDLHFINENTYLLATDGGLYKTIDSSGTWTDIDDIPISQFYHVKVNPHIANDYWGGLQDNGTTHGSLANINDWPRFYGGDGFNVEFRSDNANVIYVETQNGNIIYTDDGGTYFYPATYGIDANDRTNWNTPFIVSKHDPNILYTGTYRMYKSTSGIDPYWFAVSGDLSDGTANGSRNRTISDISESPVDPNIIYVATADGNVHISEDEGYSYNEITGTLQEFYVTDVEAGNDVNTVFVTHSGYLFNNFIPHVHLSLDKGQNWIDISGNLPQIGINDIEQHPTIDSLLFVASDGGVFYSEDLGNNWNILGDNLPIIRTSDVEIDELQNKLIAGTFARSMWTYDISDIVANPVVTIEASEDETICFGETAQMEVAGGNTYSWNNETLLSCSDCQNPIVTISETTTFTATVCLSPNNCDSTQITITVIQNPDEPTISFDGNLLNAYANSTYYQWYLDNTLIPNATQTSFLPTEDGYYSVAVSNSLMCNPVFSEEIQYMITDIVAITNKEIRIYPNPVNDVLQIETNFNITSFSITNIAGKLINKGLFEHNINVSNLKSGIYFISLFDENEQKIFAKRFNKK